MNHTRVRGSSALWIVLPLLLVASMASAAASADDPERRELRSRNVGFRKQLFVDDYVVGETQRVTRELGQVSKANAGKPIFTDGWFYGTVLHDEGRFKLWFRKPGTNGFGYAESPDGLVFKKQADLQGINFAGDYTLAVEIDSAESDPQHRFKAGYDAPGMAAGIAHSADGIRWTPYYAGANERHGNEQVKFDRKHAIGLATLRLDGFVGLSAGENEGTVVTKPFKLEGDKLMINVDAHGGEMSVEVLDEAGQPLAGFSGDEVVAGTKLDELRWQPQWKKQKNLSALRNKIVRLKFHLRDAKLYSFQIGGDQAVR